MRVATNPLEDGLRDLAEFMNFVSPDLTESQWKRWCCERREWMTFVTRITTGKHSVEPSMTLEDARRLRGELESDLSWMRKNKDCPFAAILGRLNELRLELRWQNRRIEKGEAVPKFGTVISLPGQGKTGQRFLIQSWPVTKDKRDSFYSVLGEAIRQGAIVRLRVCQECSKQFVAKDLRQCFCHPSCKDAYNNRRKMEGNKFKEYREARRANQLKKARRLKGKGLSFEQIRQETDLPTRILVRDLGLEAPS